MSEIKVGTTSPKTGELKYLYGFGNNFESEALPNALPKGQLMPQKSVAVCASFRPC